MDITVRLVKYDFPSFFFFFVHLSLLPANNFEKSKPSSVLLPKLLFFSTPPLSGDTFPGIQFA